LAFLIQSSSDVDARDSRGKTGLIYAADAGHFDCVKMLVEAGCDILAVDARGHSAEFFAEASRAKGAKGCLEYLRVAKERLALDSAARPSSYTHASPRL
jgi:ankyrin repeat protein